MVHESGIGSLLASIHDLSLLVLQKVKVLVVLVDGLHAPMAFALRDDLSAILDHKAALLDGLHCLYTKSPFLRLCEMIKRVT